ncbi:S-adenosylmethionine-dependent methyltransferase, partial [Trifolium medium]|nr:S-adenosylmethionine-dependent methyltransferase [Trifolium medium]
SKDGYLDLTVTSGLRDYIEVQPVRTELFRSPLVSFLYERGWRQNFRQSGFPGLDEEVRFLFLYCSCNVLAILEQLGKLSS